MGASVELGDEGFNLAFIQTCAGSSIIWCANQDKKSDKAKTATKPIAAVGEAGDKEPQEEPPVKKARILWSDSVQSTVVPWQPVHTIAC